VSQAVTRSRFESEATACRIHCGRSVNETGVSPEYIGFPITISFHHCYITQFYIHVAFIKRTQERDLGASTKQRSFEKSRSVGLERYIRFFAELNEQCINITRYVPTSRSSMAVKSIPSHSSLPGLWRSPTYRRRDIRTPERWLEDKRVDDTTDGLWRVHDGLYDFTTFIHKHPGGSDWLNYTKV
jgi:hypothetical protein